MKKLLWVFLIIVLVAGIAAVAGILLSRGSPSFGAPKIVTLRISRALPDYDPAPQIPFLRAQRDYSLASLYRGLLRARADHDVKGVAVYIQNTRFGLGKAQEIRDLLASLKESKQFVDCYLETAGEGSNGTLAYYLATACDHVTLAPAGEVNLIGLYADSAFFRGTLDKLKIEPLFSRAGRYKSAAETYTEYEHSPAAEEALSELLDDLFSQIVEAVAEARSLSVDSVVQLIDQAPLSAEDALEGGLIDELAYPDQFEQRLEELAGGDAELITLREYASDSSRIGSSRVAVVFAQGIIVRGEGGVEPWTQQRYLGSDSLKEVLREISRIPSIVAVVLRIDSPGGSALASDLMLREIVRLAEEKPVIVSMSDLAASGGYYIATNAAQILTQPATLTGSIGVTGGKLMTREFQRQLLGISHDTLKRGLNADFYSSLERFSPEQSERFEQLMADVYDTFLQRVSDGRGMPPEDVEQVAGGRVWTGRAAVELGLADGLGGLEQALEMARLEAGRPELDPLAVEYYPKPPSLLDILYGRSGPLLSVDPLDLRSLLEPRAPELLELPPDWARLARPF